MALFEWRNVYAVNHAQIDQQHQSLFKLAGDLNNAMLQGAGGAVLTKTLDKLVEYTRNHFRDEETLMRQSNYPGYSAHKAEHDELTRQVLELKRALESGKSSLTIETMHFLSGWLTKHIADRDKKIAEYLAERTPASKAPALARR